jgi:signal transduction histidine kinase/CheY-like chemotaxis protein
MKPTNKKYTISLFNWIWKSYLRTALIPLIVVELVFVGIYFLANNWSQKETIKFLKEQSIDQLDQLVTQEASNIQQKISCIANAVELYRQQMAKALISPASITPEDANRLTYSPEGAYYTKADKNEGGAALFYSGVVPIEENEKRKVAKVLTMQDLMKTIYKSHPLATSVYLNTFDSLNIIYPYFDVISKYVPLLDTSVYNFYYEGDATHNPNQEVRWTDAYLDPAGHGWLASAIAPIYNGHFLEGVVGIDITINTLSKEILDLEIPWDGYGLLVGKDGTILALPPKGETDWELSELTVHDYTRAILQDTFKPEDFNISKHSGLDDLSQHVLHTPNGFLDFTLHNKPRVVSWATVQDTGWKLLMIVPEQNIYSQVNVMRHNLFHVGTYMIAGLIFFYSIFFVFLYKTARKMSSNISEPLLQFNQLVYEMGNGNYYQKEPVLYVKELKETAAHLINMGQQLGTANGHLLSTQNELKNREAYLQALVNSVEDTIFEINKDNMITRIWSNDTDNLAKSYLEKNIIAIKDLLDKEAAENACQKIKKTIDTGEPDTLEYLIETRKGPRWFQARIACIANHSESVVMSARDITKRKEMEQFIIASKEEAEKANIAKSQFLSSMSHELRTPLNAVLGFSQLLELDPEAPLNESQAQCVNEISKAGNHLLQLINEMLDLVKIESGMITLSIEPVQIKTLIEETLSLIKPLADQYHIQLVTGTVVNANDFVLADRIRIKQVLINLLFNAVKYNKPNGKILFEYENCQDTIRFHVIDTGYGISKNHLKEIFKPFYRLNAKNTSTEGTGIGLTLAKQLVELMNGQIKVKSKEGLGSNFSVELPASTLDAIILHTLPIPSEKNIYSESTRSYKILYVEDNPANLNLVEQIFSHMPSVTLLSEVSGVLGIDRAKKCMPDLILLDINLPDQDGYEVFEQLRTFRETSHIPVIAVSANAMISDIKKGLHTGFNDYITKPINVVDFLEKVFKILSTDNLEQ